MSAAELRATEDLFLAEAIQLSIANASYSYEYEYR